MKAKEIKMDILIPIILNFKVFLISHPILTALQRKHKLLAVWKKYKIAHWRKYKIVFHP